MAVEMTGMVLPYNAWARRRFRMESTVLILLWQFRRKGLRINGLDLTPCPPKPLILLDNASESAKVVLRHAQSSRTDEHKTPTAYRNSCPPPVPTSAAGGF